MPGAFGRTNRLDQQRTLSFGTNDLSESVAVANVGPPVLPVNTIVIDQALFLEEGARASRPPVPSSPVGTACAQLTGKVSQNAALSGRGKRVLCFQTVTVSPPALLSPASFRGNAGAT